MRLPSGSVDPALMFNNDMCAQADKAERERQLWTGKTAASSSLRQIHSSSIEELLPARPPPKKNGGLSLAAKPEKRDGEVEIKGRNFYCFIQYASVYHQVAAISGADRVAYSLKESFDKLEGVLTVS